MYDLNGIPEDDFQRLSELLGEEKAYAYIVKNQFNYQAVVTKIVTLRIKAYLKRKPLIFTIVFIIIVIAFILVMYSDLFFF